MRVFILFTFILGLSPARAELSTFQLDQALQAFSKPEGKSSVHFRAGFYPPVNGSTTPEISLDLDVQRPLGEDDALIWSPLPLGILHSVERNAETESAVSWRLGIGMFLGWSLSPQFDSYFRRHLSAQTDFEAQLEYGTVAPLTEKPSIWSLGLSLNLRHRLTSKFALVPFFQFVTEDALMKRFAHETPSTAPPDEYFRRVAPVGLALDCAISETSSAGFEYVYRGLGMPEGHQVNLYRFSLRKNW